MSVIYQNRHHRHTSVVEVAQLEPVDEVAFGLLEFFLLEVDDADFVKDQRVVFVEQQSVLEYIKCGFEVVGPDELHPDVQVAEVTPRKQSQARAVRVERLVALVQPRVRVPERDPAFGKVFVQLVAFEEIFAAHFVLFYAVVVAPHRVP